MTSLVVVAHNIRSTHNVGSILRSAEGFGVKHCFLTGYTPYPKLPDDPRLPHLSAKIHRDITKTALGAENLIPVTQTDDVISLIQQLRNDGFTILALEQTPDSIPIQDYTLHDKTVLVLGEEVAGISQELLKLCDEVVEIPMRGKKESFNVSVAAGIAMYALTTT